MKKLMLLIVAVTILLALSGIGAFCTETTKPPPPPPPPTETTKSPLMLDTKPELATPQPKPPMDLKAPGASEEKALPKEGKTKSTR
jgi:hypothetical protein